MSWGLGRRWGANGVVIGTSRACQCIEGIFAADVRREEVIQQTNVCGGAEYIETRMCHSRDAPLITILTLKEAFYGKPILLADRDMVSSSSPTRGNPTRFTIASRRTAISGYTPSSCWTSRSRNRIRRTWGGGGRYMSLCGTCRFRRPCHSSLRSSHSETKKFHLRTPPSPSPSPELAATPAISALYVDLGRTSPSASRGLGRALAQPRYRRKTSSPSRGRICTGIRSGQRDVATGR
ncbi:hypothetical protein HD554DRAFT_1041855 [Boletus coccyginus]|nr:hypothetical protein HD554DRAFT_1041855 [Boletus coccyginus]